MLSNTSLKSIKDENVAVVSPVHVSFSQITIIENRTVWIEYKYSQDKCSIVTYISTVERLSFT